MKSQIHKVIVTNWSALREKYGLETPRIQRAIQNLVDADEARGLNSVCIALDHARALSRCKVRPVTRPANERQNKTTIDGIAAALDPDYILIIGADDVVPHQRLQNTAYSPGGDPDVFVPSDLPYACDRPHATSISAFLGPSRVVGRIPDSTNGRSPEPLLQALAHAAQHRCVTRDCLGPPFAISADSWKLSTALTLQNTYGTTEGLNLSPPDGAEGAWPSELVARRSHFINCHGASADPRFYGQRRHEFPVAHLARNLQGQVTPGTVVAAECCYGSELYDPELALGARSICETYLTEGASGFFGSSTISYGPPDSNDAADLICQFFMKHVLMGASTGRAVLEARLEFIALRAPLDPFNSKTLAQFHLLGDPSIHPVEIPRATRVLKSYLPARDEPVSTHRSMRRNRLLNSARALAGFATAAHAIDGDPPPRVKRALLEALAPVNRNATRVAAFQAGMAPPGPPAAAPPLGSKLIHRPGSDARFYCATAASDSAPTANTTALRVVIATEIRGKYTFHELQSK